MIFSSFLHLSACFAGEMAKKAEQLARMANDRARRDLKVKYICNRSQCDCRHIDGPSPNEGSIGKGPEGVESK